MVRWPEWLRRLFHSCRRLGEIVRRRAPTSSSKACPCAPAEFWEWLLQAVMHVKETGPILGCRLQIDLRSTFFLAIPGPHGIAVCGYSKGEFCAFVIALDYLIIHPRPTLVVYFQEAIWWYSTDIHFLRWFARLYILWDDRDAE